MSGYVKPGSVAGKTASASSPLKLFGHAKNCISGIFEEINGYISDSSSLIRDASSIDEGIVNSSQVELLEKYVEKTRGVHEILRRDRMKVVFFGRTSNGKSTVINAMLKNKILPSGLGHTTSCFVQVEGTDSGEAFIVSDENPSEKLSVQSVGQLAHALSKVKLEPDSLVRICWPSEKCRLLKEDVVLVDSPGIDMSPNMDQWIDKFCMDADVFVLVVNAESTLMQTEKNFFHKVSSRLSKPNVFVLNNRWDASANEPETMHEVRQQHLERDIEFLSSELNVMDQHEAEDHVFFISALEQLKSCATDSTPSTPLNTSLEGFQSRQFAFASFEKKFEECISHTALETKFTQHTASGLMIVNDVKSAWCDILQSASIKRCELQESFDEMQAQLDFTEQQLSNVLKQVRQDITDATKELHDKMAAVLADEIRRLHNILDEFDRPFDPDPEALALYKKELSYHVEECLSRNLHVRCSTFIQQLLSFTIQNMQDQLLSLVPESKQPASLGYLRTRDFDMAYHLDCPGLCAEFVEDIEFRFSLGIGMLMQKFLRFTNQRGSFGQRMGFYSGNTYEDTQAFISNLQDDSMIKHLAAFTTAYSGSTVTTLALVTLVGKAIGWRVIAVCSTIYGLLYLYERLTWTNKAKEETFKRQYIDYVSYRLGMIVEITSGNCSYQAQQELNSALTQLCHVVDDSTVDMQTTLQKHLESKSALENLVANARKILEKAEVITTHLNNFMHQFLKPSSHH